MATDRLELEAQRRTVSGKKTRFLRRAGITPANIYGHGMDSVAVEVKTLDLKHVLRHAGSSTLVNVNLHGTKEPFTVMVRDIVKNPVSDILIHVDFYKVQMSERMRADIPIHIVGVSPAVDKGGGVLVQNVRTLTVDGLPGDLPEYIEVDISGLEELHSTIYVRDLKLPVGIVAYADAEDHVVSITSSRTEAEEAAAVAEEPALVTKEREEEGEEEEKA